MDIIIGALGGILVAHFTDNRNNQDGGNTHEDALGKLQSLGRRKKLRRGVQENGKTIFIKAAKEGKTAIVKRLLAVGGIDVNATDNDGYNAIWWATKKDRTFYLFEYRDEIH